MKSLHSGGRLNLPLPPFSFTPIERLTDGFCSRWRKNISGDGEKIGSSRKGGEQTRAQAKRQKATRGRSMKARPTQSRKGVKGQLPLAGSRDSVPCGVWGNAPTVPRATIILNTLNKGAGSEASLPVTLRVRRRAPQAAFPQDSVKNYNCDAYMEICAAAEGFASADATRGHENRRSLRLPPRPLRCTLP